MGDNYRDDLGAAHAQVDRLRDENAELRAKVGPNDAPSRGVPAPLPPWLAPSPPPKAGPSPTLMYGSLVALLVLGLLAFVYLQRLKAERETKELGRKVDSDTQHAAESF